MLKKSHLHLLGKAIITEKESLNHDGQQFHPYQQKEYKSYLSSQTIEWKAKTTFHIVRTFRKSNRKIVERSKIASPNFPGLVQAFQ